MSSSSLMATKSSSIELTWLAICFSCLRILPSPKRDSLSIKAT